MALEALIEEAFAAKSTAKIGAALLGEKNSKSLMNRLDKITSKELDKNEFHNIFLLLRALDTLCESDEDLIRSFVQQGLVMKMLVWFERATEFLKMEALRYSKGLPNLIEEFYDISMSICRTSSEGKRQIQDIFLLRFGILVTDTDISFGLRLEAIRTINSILDRSTKEERKKLSLSVDHCLLLEEFAKVILEVGDYEMQVAVSEALCRMTTRKCREELVYKWFPIRCFADSFKAINDPEFETDCRQFLNEVNSYFGDERRVFTFPCIQVFLDTTELFKPKDDNLDKFWIDFNLGTSCISFFVNDPEGALWESINLPKVSVDGYAVLERDEKKVLAVQMNLPVTHCKIKGRTVRIFFEKHCDIENAAKKVFGEVLHLEPAQTERQAELTRATLDPGNGHKAKPARASSSVSEEAVDETKGERSPQEEPDVFHLNDHSDTEVGSLLSRGLWDCVTHPVTHSGFSCCRPCGKLGNAFQTRFLCSAHSICRAKLALVTRLIYTCLFTPHNTGLGKSFGKCRTSTTLTITAVFLNCVNQQIPQLLQVKVAVSETLHAVCKGLSHIRKENCMPFMAALRRYQVARAKARIFSQSSSSMGSASSSQAAPKPKESHKIWQSETESSPTQRGESESLHQRSLMRADYTRKKPKVKAKLKILPLSSSSSAEESHVVMHSTPKPVEGEQSRSKEKPFPHLRQPSLEYSLITPRTDEGKDAGASLLWRWSWTILYSSEMMMMMMMISVGHSSVKLPLLPLAKKRKQETTGPDSGLGSEKWQDAQEEDLPPPGAEAKRWRSPGERMAKLLMEESESETETDAGVIAAFQSFRKQLNEYFASRHKKIETRSLETLSDCQKHVTSLLGSVHKNRLMHLEKFQDTVVNELYNLEQDCQSLKEIEKETVVFWRKESETVEAFCGHQQQRLQSLGLVDTGRKSTTEEQEAASAAQETSMTGAKDDVPSTENTSRVT
ncbi:synaptonemal complex protein 2-like [Scleropages formosus]|nr:synaptonemal complex protein 2-like [Scleropages formosus]